MNIQTVEITSSGIRRFLNKYTPERAISEFVWNGFDAKATIVKIDFEVDPDCLDTFKSIRISDNGNGICYEDLSLKFKKFYESQKFIDSKDNSDFKRGKNGYGRLTFHKFARFAKWYSTYIRDSKNVSYDIQIQSENLKDYVPSIPVNSVKEVGTCVEFKEISSEISSAFVNQKLVPFLCAEFAWFLELKDEFKILINGTEINYSSIVAETDNFNVNLTDKNGVAIIFPCKYIRWNTKLNEEFSRFYFLNDNLDLKNSKTTLLNKKGDDYWHSLVVVSDFFNEINCEKEEDETKLKLFDDRDDAKIFKDLVEKLNDYLKTKRKPFLKKQAEILVKKYEEEKVFPKFGDNDWDKTRKAGLEDLVKEMYEVEPAIFMKLNKEQKRIFLELLNLVMDSGERESLFKIIEAVVDLDSNDRDEFAKIIKTTRLKQVISTIKLISDRLLTIEGMKKIVFEHELKANERDHLQEFIEKHYWIFGEEYRLVCSEEVKFENALRKYLYILRGVDEKTFIEHPDKYKEMDLFLAGVDFRDGKPHNVVVEIKNPILKQDCFNDKNEYWTFILIGQDYDDVLGRRILNKYTGLVQTGDNYSLYVKKWSEITNEVERRLKYLFEKLQIERSLLSTAVTLEETMNEIIENTANIETKV